MNNPTILIVDDEPFFRKLYLEILGNSGYSLETVATCREARQRLAEGGIDILLTELTLPDCSDLDLLHHCGSLPNPPDVILVTADTNLETAVKALKLGARDYLLKPFRPEGLCHLIATCIEQRRLLSENSLLKSQIRLYQRGQVLASQIEIDKILHLATKTMLDQTGGGRGFAFLATSNEVLKVYSPHLISDDDAAHLASALVTRICSSKHFQVTNAMEVNSPLAAGANLKTLCLIPLHCEQSFKGGIVLINPLEEDFQTPFPHDAISFLAEQTALGFENAFRYQGARELIYTDDLTSLYNYRYLQIMLEQEVRRTERYGLSFSLIFIDLDYFKEINDTRGHLAGSEVLTEVAHLLRKSVREVDTLFRYGGDEFTALLVETDSAGATIVAERIRRSIEQHAFLDSTGKAVTLTATVGHATFPENANDTRSLLDLADRAMYAGKKERNIVRGAWEI